jgi:hypothetical protein
LADRHLKIIQCQD